jgi:hypothetical protein
MRFIYRLFLEQDIRLISGPFLKKEWKVSLKWASYMLKIVEGDLYKAWMILVQ